MTREDYAFVADALLAMCRKDAKAPFYTDDRYDLQLRQERAEPLYDQLAVWGGGSDLVRGECHEILRRANLTDRQDLVLRLRLEGASFEAVGRLCGHSKQSAQRVFLQALKKISRAVHVYPYAGLSDVYRFETRARCPRIGRMNA